MENIKEQVNLVIMFFRRMIPDRKKYYLLALVAGLSDTFFNLLLAYMLKYIYSIITEKNSLQLYKTITFFILSFAGVFSYNYICWRFYGNKTAKISGDIRKSIFNKLCSLRLNYIEKHHSGNILSILTNDLNNSQYLYSDIKTVLSSLLLGTISTIIIFNTSWFLGLVIAVLGIIQLIINMFIIKPLEKQSKKIRENTQKLNSTFSDILQNNMSIRLYCSQSFYIKISKDIIKELYCSRIKLYIINALTIGINIFFGLLGYIFVLILGSYIINIGSLTVPKLLFITQMRLMMVQGILTFGNYAVRMQPAIISASKILSFMNYKKTK